jgi:hypothetical protein
MSRECLSSARGRFCFQGFAMKIRLERMMWAGFFVAVAAGHLSSAAIAEEPAADQQRQSLKQLLEQSTDWYDLFPDAEAKDRLRPQIVMRWQNPVRTQTGDGVLAIWTRHGRPEAMASIFQWDDDICHEFGSLSRSNTLIGRDKSDVIWSPKKSGVEFRDVPDAPIPASNRAARLRQMKVIAERFTARLPDRNVEDANLEVLRLLPTPLCRYELEESNDADPSLKDGALFAFAMGTDPEVILLLEAIGHEDKASWQFAFCRATGWGADASLGDKVVWSVKPHPGQDPAGSLMQVRRPIR